MKSMVVRDNSVLFYRWMWLLFLAIVVNDGGVVLAESWTEIDIDTTLLDPTAGDGWGGNSTAGGNPLVSPPIPGNIHGSGYLNFAELQIDVSADDDDKEQEAYSVDAVILYLKDRPQSDNELTELANNAIGAVGTDGVRYICCTTTAKQYGACGSSSSSITNQLGTMIVQTPGPADNGKKNGNNNIVMVEHRKIDLVVGGNGKNGDAENKGSSFGMAAVVAVDESEHMVLIFGDCQPPADGSGGGSDNNAAAPSIRIHGTVIWVSYVSKNTLPLFLVLTFFHVYLSIWYKHLMAVHSESWIQIETWILYTIVLAAVAMTLQTLLLATEAYRDNELLMLLLVSDLLVSMSVALSRCLYLALALGLGVTTPQLSRRTTHLLCACLGVYVLGLWSNDVKKVVGGSSFVFAISKRLVFCFDALFLVWIPWALRSTMTHLSLHGEEMKLIRYGWILRIYFLAIALSLLQIALFFEDMVHGGRKYDLMSVREGNQVIHLVILACIAYLWKPNPSQQMYSYTLLDDDIDGGGGGGGGGAATIADLELVAVEKEEAEDPIQHPPPASE